ncbi:hypothetical protein V493_07781 [Pseudogymnoascus sp. VKM F-4281 (FW-2241)]|nr:hypothetical protein V493_07781 [Pseudogymnoascus sp. VKM F-4281 (FW-2241)]
MLSDNSVANIKNLIQSPYSNYVEELHWAEKELKYQLIADLEVFQEAFKERLAGLSSEAIRKWHEKYIAWYIDQENAGDDKQAFDVTGFVNLKRVSIDNGCEAGADQHPTEFEAPEILERPARWSTTRPRRPRPREDVYIRILESLAPLNRLTHLSVKMEGGKWESLFSNGPLNAEEPRTLAVFDNIRHLDVNLCLWKVDPPDERFHLSRRFYLSTFGKVRNLESLTWKTHLHVLDEAGDLGRLLPPFQTIDWFLPPFMLSSHYYPKLRHLELHSFRVNDSRLLNCLATRQSSLQSLIFKHCFFFPSLAGIFMTLRENGVVPPVAIFENSREPIQEVDPRRPLKLTEAGITRYLVKLGMEGTLYLHAWDEHIDAFLDSTGRTE